MTIDYSIIALLSGMLMGRKLLELGLPGQAVANPDQKMWGVLHWAEKAIIENAAKRPDPVGDWSALPCLTVSKVQGEALVAHANKAIRIGPGQGYDYYMVAGFNFEWAMCFRVVETGLPSGR